MAAQPFTWLAAQPHSQGRAWSNPPVESCRQQPGTCLRQQEGTPSIWPTLLSATSCKIMAQGQPAQQDLPAALLSQTAAVTPYRTGLEARATVDGSGLQLGPSVEASQRSCCGCFARSFFRLSAVLNALTCAWSEKAAVAFQCGSVGTGPGACPNFRQS